MTPVPHGAGRCHLRRLERYLHYYNFERLQRLLSIMTPQEYHNHYLAA